MARSKPHFVEGNLTITYWVTFLNLHFIIHKMELRITSQCVWANFKNNYDNQLFFFLFLKYSRHSLTSGGQGLSFPSTYSALLTDFAGLLSSAISCFCENITTLKRPPLICSLTIVIYPFCLLLIHSLSLFLLFSLQSSLAPGEKYVLFNLNPSTQQFTTGPGIQLCLKCNKLLWSSFSIQHCNRYQRQHQEGEKKKKKNFFLWSLRFSGEL